MTMSNSIKESVLDRVSSVCNRCSDDLILVNIQFPGSAPLICAFKSFDDLTNTINTFPDLSFNIIKIPCFD